MATLTTPVPPTLKSTRDAARFAWAVVAYTTLVILWGALVRATGSGAGCGNHWPLCNGQVVPLNPTLHTLIEFTHRAMVGGSTFAVLALLGWTFRATTRGQAARTAAVVSTVLLFNEALLGALLVKLGYVTGNQSVGRVVVLAVHLSNTLLLLAALTATASLLRTGQTRSQWRLHSPRLLVSSLTALLATLFVGVSGSMAALGDTLFPATSLVSAMAQDFATGSPWLLRVRWVHPASALLALALIAWLIRRTGFDVHARTVAALLLLQFALGLADMLLLAPTWMQILHLLAADVFWIALVSLCLHATWPTRSHSDNTPSPA